MSPLLVLRMSASLGKSRRDYSVLTSPNVYMAVSLAMLLGLTDANDDDVGYAGWCR